MCCMRSPASKPHRKLESRRATFHPLCLQGRAIDPRQRAPRGRHIGRLPAMGSCYLPGRGG